MAVSKQAAILISCLKEEADHIRDEARLERRPVSSYILHILMRWVQFEERLFVDLSRSRAEIGRQLAVSLPKLPRGPRTTILLRCTEDDSKRIRIAAARRDMQISLFIRHCLRRTWAAREARLTHKPLFSDLVPPAKR